MMLIGALALAVSAPSFNCAKAVSDVERIICADEQLGQSDRAVATLYRLAVKRDQRVLQAQREWLRSRDQCHNAYCLLSSYEQRVDDLIASVGSAREYRNGPHGSLSVVALGKGLYAFSVQNLWVGTVAGAVNTAGASGVFELAGARGERQPFADYDAGWRLTRLSRNGWRVECLPDETSCGGVNAIIDGDYR